MHWSVKYYKILPLQTVWRFHITGTCFIQKIYAPSFSLLQGKHLPFSPSPLRVRTAQFSKKSLWSDVREIKKMSVKLKKKLVLTPRNVREKSNTVIYHKMPPKHRHQRLDATKQDQIKKWDINLYLYICMFLRFVYNLVQLFQRSRLKYEKLTDGRRTPSDGNTSHDPLGLVS
jgi:hypothetical protein